MRMECLLILNNFRSLETGICKFILWIYYLLVKLLLTENRKKNQVEEMFKFREPEKNKIKLKFIKLTLDLSC